MAGDWPAPGFQLGFGRLGHSEDVTGDRLKDTNYVVDADGTIHTAVELSRRSIPGAKLELKLRTVDGSFIDYLIQVDISDHRIRYGTATLPNGMTIQFNGVSDADPNMVFPTVIVDAQGNFIRINYHADRAPEIDTIVDTLGRVVRFHYDSERALTAITAPGYAGGPDRVLARLHYRYMPLMLFQAFMGETKARCAPNLNDCLIRVLDAVFYPQTLTGYWTEYSYYGILTQVNEQRRMSMSFIAPDGPSRLNEQGAINQGDVTRSRYYNYPQAPANLTNVPAFSQMYECWVSQPNEYKATAYHYRTDDATRTSTTYLPFGDPAVTPTCGQPQYPQTQPIPTTARIVEESYIRKPTDQVRFDDGMHEYTEILDASGNSLRRTASYWEPGDDQGYPLLAARSAYNQRVSRVDHGDERGRTRSTRYEYGLYNNQVFRVTEQDFDGTVLQKTETEYDNNPSYREGRHILNLPKVIRAIGGPGRASGEYMALTEINYDEGDLQETRPGAVMREEAYNSSSPFFDPSTIRRGLPTNIRRYADPAARDAGTMQEERRKYDDTGNLVQVNGSACCEQQDFVFLPETQYSQPSRILQGAADPASAAHIQESFVYDFATGLLTQRVDANGRASTLSYEPDTLRLQSETLPTKNPSGASPIPSFGVVGV